MTTETKQTWTERVWEEIRPAAMMAVIIVTLTIIVIMPWWVGVPAGIIGLLVLASLGD